MTLTEKSINTLELPLVLAQLSEKAGSEAAKEQIMNLRPSNDIYEVRRRLEETTAAKTLLGIKGSLSFFGLKDVRPAVYRAERGGMLNCRELLDIGALLRAARTTQVYPLGDKPVNTAIDYLFNSLRANRYYEDKIASSILSEEEIADTASPELADIRRHIRNANEKVRQSLQKIISSPSYAKALQEPIITTRNGRYVVPVKSEHRASVPGLVHDISSSGATLFIEPMGAVQANNDIRELMAKEKIEIDRILMTLSAEAASFGEDIVTDVNVLTQLDMIFAKANLSFEQDGGEPELSEDGRLYLRRARHPLLPKGTAVPIDIRLGGEFDTLVITGPNTGGKTVSLKTMGLLCLMAQCGLHIPAGDGSCVPVFKKILADIGDEQSIEQSLSTFSSHMVNIVEILKECEENTLLLFDELGAGTDPVEGAALAVSIIEYARSKGAMISATTHYAELKVYALTEDGVQNASCEFDVETLKPTYKLLIGIPGKSNAFAISAKLGLPENIIEDAKGRVDTGNASFEEVLENLEKTRQSMEKDQTEARRLLMEAKEDAKTAAEKRERAAAEREKVTKTARHEANRILRDARAAADEVFKELDRMRKQAVKDQDWQQVNEARARLRRELNLAEDRLLESEQQEEEEQEQVPDRPIKAGDTVKILSIGAKAQVLSIAADGTLNLQAGIMKVTAKPDEVRLIEDDSVKKQVESFSAHIQSYSDNARPELDIRGMMTDEAIPVVDKYIDSAKMAKLNTVTIIHGKGTGALRAAVQAELKRNPHVKSYRNGKFGEGENGVTVVELKK